MPARKPDRLKLVEGTFRQDRAQGGVEYEPTNEIPQAPDWLPNAHAINEWDRLAPILHKIGLLTQAGLSALGALCALHGDIVDQWSRRISPNAATLAQYRALVNDFGLTPVAQGKVKTLGEEKPKNKFSDNGKRPA
jgi:phage terminase small subunit